MSDDNLNTNQNDIINFTASKSKRLLNFVIDLIFILILIFIFGLLLGVYSLILNLMNLNDPINVEKLLNNNVMNILINSVIMFIYYLFFESIFGRSIGKLITKTKVVDKEFNKPKLSKIVLRTLIRLIPFEQLSFIKSDIGLHDNLSKTYVIDINKSKKQNL